MESTKLRISMSMYLRLSSSFLEASESIPPKIYLFEHTLPDVISILHHSHLGEGERHIVSRSYT